MTWPMVPLGEVLASSRSGYWGDVPGSRDVNTLAVRNGDIGAGLVNWTRVPTRSVTRSEYERARIKSGDILLTTSGDVGKTALVTEVPTEAIASNFVRILRVDPDRILPDYLAHWLGSPGFTAGIAPFTRGTTMQNLSVAAMETAVRVPLPPLPEQRRIAAILDRASALVTWERRRLALKVRLAPYGHSESRVMQVGDVFTELRNGVSPSRTGHVLERVLTLGAITTGNLIPSEARSGTFRDSPPTSRRVGSVDYLVARGSGTKSLVGRGAVVRSEGAQLVFPDTMIGGRLNQDEVDVDFFHHVWNGRLMRLEIERLAKTTNGTFKVNQEGLSALPIGLPPLGEQRRVGDFLRARGELSERQARAIDVSVALLSALRDRAFKGELES
ncbi:Type-1 restriction enzyme EcoKI specificity protein [Pseudoclavibacter triregionum]|nr:Type-1 restriction enzyme EcoKI specificity protein [Pseudoclavibacter triregionum]